MASASDRLHDNRLSIVCIPSSHKVGESVMINHLITLLVIIALTIAIIAQFSIVWIVVFLVYLIINQMNIIALSFGINLLDEIGKI